MSNFIYECVFSETMSTKWNFMLADAQVTLSKAFDTMILSPDKVSKYSSRVLKVDGVGFEVSYVSIGYASFAIATSLLHPRIVLIDASLNDGDDVVEWQKLPHKAKALFAKGASW